MATGKNSPEDAEEKKRKRIEEERKKHPHGTCLLARDTPFNRGLFPDGPFGKITIRNNQNRYGETIIITFRKARMLTVVFLSFCFRNR
jgi:hypothetical protein